MVTIAPDEDGRTDAFEVADRRRGERTPSAHTSTRVAVRWRTARRGKKTLEREEESVCRAPTRGGLAHEDAHVVRV